MEINAPSMGDGQDQPLYVWPGTGELVNWSTLLRLWGSEVARLQPGAAGLWICDRLLTLAAEADTWQLTGPAHHTQHSTDQADHEAAYIAALESETHRDPGDEPEHQFDCNAPDIFGSLLGHDDSSQRAWLPTDPNGETMCN
jgi:hypothetical protein